MTRPRRGGELRRTSPRPADRRRGNRVFYVIAEGQRTEYDYLGHLNISYGSDLGFFIRIPGQRRGMSPSQVVGEACRIDEAGVEVWGLFDHDGRTDIDQVCARARRHHVRVAMSHPAFELWLLLHFQDFPPAAQHGSSTVVLKKLRAAHAAFADYGEGDKRITARRFEALCEGDGIRLAASRAHALARDFAARSPSSRDPSTDVYRLVDALGIRPGVC